MENIPWTESPFFEDNLAKWSLSQSDKAFAKSYADDGYVLFDPKMPEPLLDKAIEQMEPHFAKIKGLDRRIQDAWKYSSGVRWIAANFTVIAKLKLLYQRDPIPFQTLNFDVGTEQATHSDLVHFGSFPSRYMCGVWVALEDITDFNGPLHYYPGSHKLSFVDFLEIGVKASAHRKAKSADMVYSEDYTKYIQRMIEAKGLKKETLNIKKGQAIIWSANLLHGGDKILHPGSTRFSQVTHYFFEGCMYYVPRLSDVAINKIYLSDITNISTGKRVRSTYFGKVVKPALSIRAKQFIKRIMK